MRTAILLFLLFFSLIYVKAQNEFCHAIGSNYQERGYSLLEAYDGGFIICGYTRLIKLDANYNVEWQKTLTGNGWAYIFSIIPTWDSGYAVAGYLTSGPLGNKDFYFAKLDALGNIQWDKAMGGFNNDAAFSVIQTTDSGYALAGYSSSFGPYPDDMYVVKLSKTGNAEWKTHVGGGNQDHGYAIVQTYDGGFAITGDWSATSNGKDVYIVKLKTNGGVEWSRYVGHSSSLQNIGYSILQEEDSSLTVAGYTRYGAGSKDIYLLNVNKSGSLMWTKTIGGTANEGPSIINKDLPEFCSLKKTADKGYIIAGSTQSFGVEATDAYVIKLDSLTNIQWTKTIGNAGFDEAFSIIQTRDGKYALTGRTTSFGAGGDDIFFAVLDSLGNGCCNTGSGAIVGSGGINGTNHSYNHSGSIAAGGRGIETTTLTAVSKCLTCIPPTTSVTPSSSVMCFGDSVIISSTVTGGVPPYSYSWSPGGQTTAAIRISPTTTTTYSLTVTDSVLCKTTVSQGIIVNPLPQLSITGISSLCNGQIDTLKTSGSASLNYFWSPYGQTTASIVISPTISTFYSVTGTDSNGCSRTINHNVAVSNCPNLSTFCFSSGRNMYDFGTAVVQAYDGGYLAAGYSHNLSYGNNGVYLIKLSTNGYVQWSKSYKILGASFAYDIIKTIDYGYVVVGSTGSSLLDSYIMKIDSTGDLLWTKTFGGQFEDEGFSVIQTSDGGYAMTGTMNNSNSVNDVLVVKLDGNGNQQWLRCLSQYASSPTYDYGYSIIQTPDNGYTIAGKAHGVNTDDDVYMVRLSSNGSLIWAKKYRAKYYDNANTLVMTDDGGYLLAGKSTSYIQFDDDVLLIKTDASGTLQWSKIIHSSGDEEIRSIVRTDDKGYLMVGSTTSFGAGGSDVYLVKLDSNLNFQWDKTLGTSVNDVGMCIRNVNDGGMIIAGYKGYTEFFISKLDAAYNGCCISSSGGGTLINLTLTESSIGLITKTSASVGSGGTQALASTYLNSACSTNMDSSCVWPGDANSDGKANNHDLLAIGLGYSQTDSVRPNASNLWKCQPGTDWKNALVDGTNYKHVDCDGNGIINSADTIAIIQNYGQIHLKKEIDFPFIASNPNLHFVISQIQYPAGSWIEAEVWAGDSILPVMDLYGIAFKLNYTSNLIEPGTMKILFAANWLGSPGIDAIKLGKVYESSDLAEGAFTRIDHKNSSGYGKIGVLRFRAKSTISSKSTLNFKFLNYEAVDSAGNQVSFNVVSDSIFIIPTSSSVDENLNNFEFHVYPNPSEGIARIQYNLHNSSYIILEVYNALGEKVKEIIDHEQSQGRYEYSFNLERSGLYFIRLSVDDKSEIMEFIKN